jgi:hypothetical protein
MRFFLIEDLKKKRRCISELLLIYNLESTFQRIRIVIYNLIRIIFNKHGYNCTGKRIISMS